MRRRLAAAGAPPAAPGAQATPPQASATEKPAPVTREFPAGSYIIRMDQPYSRIADALLDYQYWAPNDAQARPYDDTGWTFPEGFGVQSVRVTDVKVLDAPMELVKGEVKAVSGVTGQGSLFAINHTGDNSLITLRYKLKDADIQVAEEPFESSGAKFNRGTFIVKGVAQGDLDAQLTALGLRAVALTAAPTVKTHAARAARVAILHQWTSTQTEGWWRQAFDIYGVPYDYIDPETVKKTANLRAKYDVIVFGPGGSQGAVEGTPMWRNADPLEQGGDAEHRHVGPDRRHARRHGPRGADAPAGVHRPGRRVHRLEQFGRVRDHQQLHLRRERRRCRQHDTRGRFAAADEARGRDEPDRLRRARQPGDVQQQRRRSSPSAPRRAAAGAGARLRLRLRRGSGRRARRRGRRQPRDRPRHPGRPGHRAGSAHVRGDQPDAGAAAGADAAVAVLAADRRAVEAEPGQSDPAGSSGLASHCGSTRRARCSCRACSTAAPTSRSAPWWWTSRSDKGHVVLFANNPIYRGETIGSYSLVFNAILNFDSLNAGRKLDAK